MSYIIKLVDSLGSLIEFWPRHSIANKVKHRKVEFKVDPQAASVESAWASTAEEMSDAYLFLIRQHIDDQATVREASSNDEKAKWTRIIELAGIGASKHCIFLDLKNSREEKLQSIDELLQKDTSELIDYLENDSSLFNAVRFDGRLKAEESGNNRRKWRVAAD